MCQMCKILPLCISRKNCKAVVTVSNEAEEIVVSIQYVYYKTGNAVKLTTV